MSQIHACHEGFFEAKFAMRHVVICNFRRTCLHSRFTDILFLKVKKRYFIDNLVSFTRCGKLIWKSSYIKWRLWEMIKFPSFLIMYVCVGGSESQKMAWCYCRDSLPCSFLDFDDWKRQLCVAPSHILFIWFCLLVPNLRSLMVFQNAYR